MYNILCGRIRTVLTLAQTSKMKGLKFPSLYFSLGISHPPETTLICFPTLTFRLNLFLMSLVATNLFINLDPDYL